MNSQWLVLGAVLLLLGVAAFWLSGTSEEPDVRPEPVPPPPRPREPEPEPEPEVPVASSAPATESVPDPLGAALGGLDASLPADEDEDEDEDEDVDDMETVQASAEDIARMRAEFDRRSEVED